jgi:D-3-phosphoglycerate dehydrogenase / 2-oxoglutarate reductase
MMLFMARKQFSGMSGTELKGKNIGIHAYGYVGTIVARMAQVMGMKVFAFDPFVSKEKMDDDRVYKLNTVEELYHTCQYISIHIPANSETKNSVNFELMSKLPIGGTIINTARKEVICEQSLQKMFSERTDFKYITDILPACHNELLKYELRYFATPKKQGAETSEANINAGIAAAEQIIKFFKFGDKTFQVNR